jgi:hypothetical protein
MGVFSAKSKKENLDKKMVGAYIDSNTNSYISLYCVSQQENKSNFLKNLIMKWYNKSVEKNPPDYLIEQVAAIAQKEWNWRKLNKMPNQESEMLKRFDSFKSEIYNDLKTKGVSKEHTDKIIQRIEL